MQLIIDLNSRSVTYEDIGARPRARRGRVRVGRRGPRIRRPLARDPMSKLKRERSNLRNGIKKRLDNIKFRRVPADKISQQRQEARSMFQEFKRVDRRYQAMKKRGAQRTQKAKTARGRKRD